MGLGVAAGGLLIEAAALDLGGEVAAVAAVVSGEAGIDLVRAEDDGLGVGPTLDHPTDERGNRQTPFGVHRVQRASVNEVFQFHLLIRPLLRKQAFPVREGAHPRPRVTRWSARKCPKLSTTVDNSKAVGLAGVLMP